MAKIWFQPTTLAAHTITGKPHKLSAKLLLLCAPIAASTSMLAQTPICPDPWAKAKVVYGQVTLKAQESRTANGETQTINQTGTAQFPLYRDTLGDLGSCGWAGGIGSPPASLNDKVEHPCTTD